MLSNVARMPVPPPTIGPLSLSSATARDAWSQSTDDEEDNDSKVEDNLKDDNDSDYEDEPEDDETGAEDKIEECVPSSNTSRKRHRGAHEGGLAKRLRSSLTPTTPTVPATCNLKVRRPHGGFDKNQELAF
jgi:hypothetical protein